LIAEIVKRPFYPFIPYCKLFRFLSMLEEEVYGDNSPIWDDDFTVPQSLSLGPSRITSPLTPLTDKGDSLVATAR